MMKERNIPNEDLTVTRSTTNNSENISHDNQSQHKCCGKKNGCCGNCCGHGNSECCNKKNSH